MALSKLLVDSNIVIDYLNRREPFFESARMLMLCGRVGEFSLWMASSQVPGLIYVLSDGGKERLIPSVLERLRAMRSFVNIAPVGSDSIDAMLATKWTDPEDALLHSLALDIHADAIISRDKKFAALAKETISVFTSEDYFDYLETERGISYAEMPFPT